MRISTVNESRIERVTYGRCRCSSSIGGLLSESMSVERSMMSLDARDGRNSRSGMVCLSSIKGGPETVQGIRSYTAGGSFFSSFRFLSCTTCFISFIQKQHI